MSKRTGPTNEKLIALIRNLKKLSNSQKAPIWKRIAFELEKPTRSRVSVNLSKIEIYIKPNEIALVPGKVLGTGTTKAKVVAFSFSSSAKEKLGKNMIKLENLIKENPKAKGVRIIC